MQDTPLTLPRLDVPPNPDLVTLQGVFAGALALPYRQSWLTEPGEFIPATAHLAWDAEGNLCVFAELVDDDIFTHASTDNQRFWLLGDVLEVFVHQEGYPEYYEFHVTPNGHQLRLGFRSTEHRMEQGTPANPGPAKLEDYMLPPVPGLITLAWSQPERGRWFGYMRVPLPGLFTSFQPDATWAVNVCRYDYSRPTDGEALQRPVVSCTAPLTRRDFHYRDDWTRVK